MADVQQIVGTARTVGQLLTNSRYGLDFYQREYSWGETQVCEFVEDLADRFLSEFKPEHERRDVELYRPYFLGPIVTVQRGDGVRYLVDGQQRITTLSLMLIYLFDSLEESYPEECESLKSLVFSTKYGEKTFNLHVPEREECLSAILEGRSFDLDGRPASVRNIWNRYETICSLFPEDLHGERGETLPYFADWLKERVVLVEIAAPDQEMALEIFETMNDRGLRLSNIDMLKSFLLSQIRDEDTIRDLNERWRRRITELADYERNADTEFVKAWLRGDYAVTQRERKAKAQPRDFEMIGTAFHKWVRDNQDRIGLSRPDDYRRLIEHDFMRLSGRYLQLLQSCRELDGDLESVYHNACAGVNLQLPMILAAVTPDDDNDTFREKAALVAGALDIYVVRRMANSRNFGHATVVYTMFNLMKEVRDRPTDEIREVLSQWLNREDERIEGLLTFRLNRRNRKHVRYLLARMTAWMDDQLETGTAFTEYVATKRKHPFEVEHIWADDFDRHSHEFADGYEFAEHRNKLGGLLLLSKDKNASYGAMEYEDKVEHYHAQNPLAQSLHPKTYQNNPSFLKLRDEHGLGFKPISPPFTRANIDERQELYRDLAEIIWAPSRHGLE